MTLNLECVSEAKMPSDCHSQREKSAAKKVTERASKLDQCESFRGEPREFSFVLENESHYSNPK